MCDKSMFAPLQSIRHQCGIIMKRSAAEAHIHATAL